MDFCHSEPVFNKVPLYQPDQLTFNHTSVAPTTISATSTTENNNNNNSNHHQHHSDLNNSNAKNNPLVTLDDSASTSPSWTPPSYELQEMLIHYQSQPDLLQLILESKLQEDKRRTEEARLRAKELDLMLLQHQQLHRNSFTTSSLLSEMTTTTSTPSSSVQNHHHHQQQQDHDFRKRRHSSLNNITENSSEELDDVMFLQQLTSSFPDSSTNNSNNDTQGTLSTYPLNELYHPHDPLIKNTSSSSTTITTNITTPTTPSSSSTISTSSSLSPSSPSTPNSSFISSSSNNDNNNNNNNNHHQKPRKRREMQAITKLVETREFPYLDGYFWRNNGNTIQKKTGNKSVYYKCSNSSKNCTVNKTILFKENGEYLIKYRGEHLPECGKVQHIVDV
ncbi:unnamed protein product [Cunninghamella blakesleeana]